MRQNNKEAQKMTGSLCTAIQRFISQQQKQAVHKNSNKNQSLQINAKHKKIQEKQHNEFKNQSLYDQMIGLLEKLKKIMKRMNTINKIKKAKLNIFNSKLMDFIQELSNLIETKVLNINLNKFVIALVQQTSKAITECDRILNSFERQSNAFCCGRNQEAKYTFYKSIINVIGYGPVWSFIPNFSPEVQEKIQRIQILTPLKYDFQQLEKLIKKQVLKYWPQQIQKQVQIVRQIKCDKPHVQSQVIESKQSAVSSISSESEELQIKNLNQQAPNNYIKIQEVTKLKQDLEYQKTIRQTHEKLFGFGRPQQVSDAIEAYGKIAQKMNDKSSIVCNALGQIYEEGKFAETDRQKSEEYYRRSASLNDPQGFYKLGKYLQKGLIKLAQNQSNTKAKRQDQLRTAIAYYEKAAEMNHLDAITDLGYIYQKGIQATGSFLKVSQVSKSDNQSQQSIKTNTNSTYFIEPNLKFAIKYYTIAKKAEFPRAINNLGTLLIRQHNSITQKVKGSNLQKGIKYLKKAAHLGYLKAYFNMGKCYENGLGVQKNYENAKKYYQRGSQKGDIACKVEFIKCFFTDGFPKNAQSDDSKIAKLIDLIRQVLILEPNNKQCLFYMGLLHQRGDGVNKNPQLAFNYILKSAGLNYLPALTKLGDYKYSGFYVTKDLEGAVRLYEKAAKGGDPQAMINLSLVLEKNLIKPTKGSSPDYIKHLQRQALKTKSSNAYLIAGLKEQNYRVNARSPQHLNDKILKSVQLGNRDAINLIEKTRRGDNAQKWVKFEPKTKLNSIQNYALRTDRTIPFENSLKRIRSAQNLKITKA